MHPNTMQHTKTWVYGPMGSIRCVRCEKLQCDFLARTFVLMAPVNSFCTEFHAVMKRSQMHPKHNETLQNMNLGSNRMHRARLLRKITTWLRGTNFCISTSSPRFAPSFMQLWNDPKSTQTLWYAPKHELRDQWDGSTAFVVKNYNVTSWHELLH